MGLFPQMDSNVNPWSMITPLSQQSQPDASDKYMQAPSSGGGGGGGGDSKGIDLGAIIKLIGSLAL